MIKYCKRCLFPETKPDLYFDEHGVCDACNTAERKNGIENAIDWDERAAHFSEIIQGFKERSMQAFRIDIDFSYLAFHDDQMSLK